MSDVVLECQGIEKGFGGIPVLAGVSLSLQKGTVTALAGENGAGKSTLMKIASGLYHADAGTVTIDGHLLHGGDVRAANRHGTAIVPQELESIHEMTVYENLFVGKEIRRAGVLNRRAMIKETKHALEDFDVAISPTARMGSLPVGMQQIIEIVKATRTGARALLLDEPTSSLSKREVTALYGVIRRLRDRGVAMMFTTHKMEEIRALADRVVVLRDGQLILDQSMAETSDHEIVTSMIGRELEDLFPPVAPPTEQTLLEVQDLQVLGASGPVSLTLKKGEILGLAGLVGAGRTELIEGIFGVRHTTGGTIAISSKPVKRNSAPAAIAAGMALVPEDRKKAGVVLGMSVLDNGSLPRLSILSRLGLLRNRVRNRQVGEAMQSVRLRSRGLTQTVGTLSGGNQQKVVLARWLTGKVDVLLLDEPTRGVDVGARSEIYRIIVDLAASGMAVVMASSDMPEILGLSHRAVVMREGRVVGELDRGQLDRPDVQAVIFQLAAGLPVAAPDTPPQVPAPHTAQHHQPFTDKEVNP